MPDIERIFNPLSKKNLDAIRVADDLMPPVIDFYDPTDGLPEDPTIGDRYIADATAEGWTIDYIYEWDGETWVESEPSDGWMIWVMIEFMFYFFFSGAWTEAIDHGALRGLTHDDHLQYLLADGSRNFTGDLLGLPEADSLTFFQIQRADTTVVLNVDTTNGRVGIGTDSPDKKLHVVGPLQIQSAAYGGMMLLGADAGGTTITNDTHKQARIAGVSYANTYNMAIFAMQSTSTVDEVIVGSKVGNTAVAPTRISFHTTPVRGDSLETLERMVIKDDGNVGIGTIDPGTAKLAVMNGNVGIGTTAPGSLLEIGSSTSGLGHKLRVNSDIVTGFTTFGNMYIANDYDIASFGTRSAGHEVSAIKLMTMTAAGSTRGARIAFLNTDVEGVSSDTLKFMLGGGVGIDVMNLRADGKVGIGTASPVTELEVVGTVTVTTGTTGQSTIGAGLIVNNDSGNGVINDFQVNSDTLTAIFVDASEDTMVIGIPTTFTKDLFFVGDGSGIPYGHMYTDTTIAVTLADDQVAVEVEGTWITGEVNLITFGADHFLTVTKAGRYKIDWDMSIHADTITGGAIEIESGVMVDGAAKAGGRSHASLRVTTVNANISGTHILDLAADEQVSLYVLNETNGDDVDVEHANVTITMVGGT